MSFSSLGSIFRIAAQITFCYGIFLDNLKSPSNDIYNHVIILFPVHVIQFQLYVILEFLKIPFQILKLYTDLCVHTHIFPQCELSLRCLFNDLIRGKYEDRTINPFLLDMQ